MAKSNYNLHKFCESFGKRKEWLIAGTNILKNSLSDACQSIIIIISLMLITRVLFNYLFFCLVTRKPFFNECLFLQNQQSVMMCINGVARTVSTQEVIQNYTQNFYISLILHSSINSGLYHSMHISVSYLLYMQIISQVQGKCTGICSLAQCCKIIHATGQVVEMCASLWPLTACT